MGKGYQWRRIIYHINIADRLWGNPAHLQFLNDSLREQFAQDNLHILVPKSNAGNFTYDGIELGGERVTSEIEERLRELAKSGVDINRISVIGYSLGGLIARYAIGLLYHKGIFESIQPIVRCMCAQIRL
jgi:esterase/lipase